MEKLIKQNEQKGLGIITNVISKEWIPLVDRVYEVSNQSEFTFVNSVGKTKLTKLSSSQKDHSYSIILELNKEQDFSKNIKWNTSMFQFTKSEHGLFVYVLLEKEIKNVGSIWMKNGFIHLVEDRLTLNHVSSEANLFSYEEFKNAFNLIVESLQASDILRMTERKNLLTRSKNALIRLAKLEYQAEIN